METTIEMRETIEQLKEEALLKNEQLNKYEQNQKINQDELAFFKIQNEELLRRMDLQDEQMSLDTRFSSNLNASG